MTTPKLGLVTVIFRTPDGRRHDINLTDPAAVRAGEPSALGRITISKSPTGPTGHDRPTQASLTLTSATPTPWPLGTEVSIRTPHPDEEWTYLAAGWVEDDTVEAAGKDRWRHAISITDAITRAADRACGITRPAETAAQREAALTAAHPDLFQYGVELAVGGPQPNPVIAPLSADTSVLVAAQRLAMATGQIVGSLIRSLHSWPLRDAYSDLWWARWPAGPTYTCTKNQLANAAATLNRTCHISRVDIGYHAAGDTTYRVEHDTEWPTTLAIDSGLHVDQTTGSTDLAWLTYLARTITTAPTEPILATTTLLHDWADPTTLPRLLGDLTDRPLIRIHPAPAHAGGLHILDGWTLTIHADLDLTLNLDLTPAGLYGLRSMRCTEMGTTRAHLTYRPWGDTGGLPWPGQTGPGRYTRITALNPARPPA